VSRLTARLAAAGLDWAPHHYFAVCFAIGSAVFRLTQIAGFSPGLAVVAASFCAWGLPRAWLDMRARRRRRAFLKAFATAIDMVVRGARSGLAMMDCLGMVASDAPEPVRAEFEIIVGQLRAGVPLPVAMEKLAAAMPAPEVRFFALIMSIQSETGGNLSDALGNLAKLLRDREQLAAKVRVASAEVRASAIAVGIMPFVVIGATTVLSPAYIALLWTEPAGRSIAILAACWLLIGIGVLRRMARIEV
jgi:tight adherence protein B